MNEIVSLDGKKFQIWYSTPNGRQHAISEAKMSIKGLQTNLAQNPGFETVSPTAQYQPANWWSDVNSGTPSFPYNSPSDLPGRTGKGAAIVATTTVSAYWGQRISGVTPSSQYTLTGYVKTTSVTGTGAFLEVDWFDSNNGYISGSASTSVPKTGTSDWSQLTVTSTAPPNAASANIILFLNGSGTVIFDDISFTSGGGGGGGAGYNCVSGNCQYVSSGAQYSTLAACQSACTVGGGAGYNCVSPGNCQYVTSGGQYSTLAACQSACTSGGGGGPPTCDPLTCPSDTNYCVLGQCIKKNYVLYGGIGFLALFMLSMFKK